MGKGKGKPGREKKTEGSKKMTPKEKAEARIAKKKARL
jgi:hypothetical protein